MERQKTPMRKCIGCDLFKPKKEMLRIVLNKQGDIKLDKSQTASGRGAYICISQECFEKACSAKRLERSLKNRVSNAVYENLKEEIEDAK